MNLPKVLKFDDYHEIDYVGNHIKKIIPEIKWKELDPTSNYYLAVFYVGDIPSNEEIENLSNPFKRKRK